MKLGFQNRFSENPQISNFIKIRLVGAELSHANGQTDRRDETVTFRNFANSPKSLKNPLDSYVHRLVENRYYINRIRISGLASCGSKYEPVVIYNEHGNESKPTYLWGRFLRCFETRSFLSSSCFENGTVLHPYFFFFSSGPRAYAPNAPQPVGLLCYPSVLHVPTFAASSSPRPCYPRDP
jgi:hypothetical protein